MLGHPTLRRNWKFNLLSVNERFAIVKLNWSTIFKVDDLRVNKVGKRCQLVLQHFGQLGRVNKLWGSNLSKIFSTKNICHSGKLFACYVQTFSKSNLIRPEDFSSVDKIVEDYFYFRSTQVKFFNKRSPNLQFLSFSFGILTSLWLHKTIIIINSYWISISTWFWLHKTTAGKVTWDKLAATV